MVRLGSLHEFVYTVTETHKKLYQERQISFGIDLTDYVVVIRIVSL
jgi:hypothetical protein